MMADRVVETIASPNGEERLIIVQRADGRYSFRKQRRADDNYKGLGVFVWTDGFAEEEGWRPPGPYLGIYDSAETAKWEALGKVDWVVSSQPSN
jgi:hypothetical protein